MDQYLNYGQKLKNQNCKNEQDTNDFEDDFEEVRSMVVQILNDCINII